MRAHVHPDELVVDLAAVGLTDLPLVGGKAAQLGELTRIEGAHVPAGWCITTTAHRHALASNGATAVPDDVAAAVTDALTRLDPRGTASFAVRSSATVEDSPTASFAGLHDSFLDVVGAADVLDRVVRCWASLSSERAVVYRQRHGIDDDSVAMAVVVQRMVSPTAAGVMFTADPVTGHRRVVAIEAVHGSGDALVLGHVAPEVVRVRDGRVVEHGAPADARGAVLSDAEALALADLGRHIESALGQPQDIEWCLAADDGSTGRRIHVVQSRPITHLFPIPAATDGAPHVYLSVGHQQMMTDAMTPLGLTLWQRLAMAPMREAGGRLFVDVAPRLADTATRDRLLELFGRSDPLTRDAMQTVIERGDLLPPPPPAPAPAAPPSPPAASTEAPPLPADPAVIADLIRRNEASVDALERALDVRTGVDVVDIVAADLPELQRVLTDPVSLQVINAGMEATWWLNDHLAEWLGEHDAADVLSQSAPGNVTSEMGLALLDVADAIRPHPELVAYLRRVDGDDGFLDVLPGLAGGREARDAIVGYLDRYGVRCVGEIDLGRPRWSERPSTLVPVILADVDRFEPGEARRRFQHGLQRAAAAERRVLDRLSVLPDGEAKAAETRRMVDRLRRFIGYREYPKFGIVRRLAIWRRALLAEADRLVEAGALRVRDDLTFLRFEEVRDVVSTRRCDAALIARRRAEHAAHRALIPPRVITSDGEVITGSYRRDGVPPGALVGVGVSAGIVEGRARVVVDMSAAELQAGDVLVTAFTDPSWSPLFVAAAALVTEVGGAMTHGSVIAREYGLPAVVGVERATALLRDGQRIRVHGGEGWVEPLEP